MSLVTFNPVRYYTADDVFHYTVDNRPLQDLTSNDILLQAGLDILAAAVTGGISAQDFSAGVDFTAGTSTHITLANAAVSTSLWVFFDGVYQNVNTYVLTNNSINFSSAIPFGVSTIEVKWSNSSTTSFSTTSVIPISNAGITLPTARDIIVIYSGVLTANQTVTLTPTSTVGFKLRVVRDSTVTGVYSISIFNGNAGLKLLTIPGSWADFVYTSSGWAQIAAGTL